jgi:AcrR family transcriptional regulator
MELTRSRIIGTAIDLIERDGVDALSMRALATELGCGMVALYCRFPSREALLDQVAVQVLSSARRYAATEPDWQARVRGRARALRDAGRAYPRCAVIAATRPAWTAVPAHIGADDLATLRRSGGTAEQLLPVMRALAAYILGSVLGEAGPAGIGQENPDADFEFGLDLFVRAAAALLSAPARP